MTGETPLTMRVGGHSAVKVDKAVRYSSSSPDPDFGNSGSINMKNSKIEAQTIQRNYH